MYLHYASNEHNPQRNIYEPRKTVYDDNDRYVGSYYTKDGFYEAMRRMIVYGPTDWDYIDKAPDYRNMTGEFRTRNAELFIDDNAANIEAAKRFGLHAIRFEGYEKSYGEVMRYLRETD